MGFGFDSETVLDAAILLANEAGALLREEFHRPGGPRGTLDASPIESEVSRLIRGRLLEFRPEWPVLGGEGVGGGAEASTFRWLVHPNVGASSFQKGMRGSAISIALLRKGEPVLGVVFAPLSPDDEGDCIAWAEGMPLLRNGQPILRDELPDLLAGGQVVLVSQRADENASRSLQCVRPARFRTVPGIAYRLALVAVGEGDATVGLNRRPLAELAAGHALLRAVGGEVVCERGEPVQYHQKNETARVFGGSPELVRQLARRDWSRVLSPSDEGGSQAAFPLAKPVVGRAVRDADRLARAQGCLLGQIAGDSLGSRVEFQSAEEIGETFPEGVRDLVDGGRWNTLAGQPTDDSELALMLARSLLDGFDPGRVREAYGAWFDSSPFDIGNTTRRGLLGDPDGGSQANGALMRISPLGIFGHALPVEALAELARTEAGITHPHPVCRDASAAFVVAVAHAVRTGAGGEAAHAAALGWAKGAGAQPAVVEALEAATREPPSEFQHQMGWVRIALQNAFYRLLRSESLEAGVVATVMAGGDADTNAAIAGALLGAVHGREALPMQWRRAILSCRPIEEGYRQRPRPFWPVDALVLAERLLLAGQLNGSGN